MNTTKLQFRNDSEEPVLVYITLGAVSGCVQDVADITVSDGIVINRLFALMGNFTVPARTTVDLTAPAGLGFNGNFSVGTPPLNCPTDEWPEGVCLAEFMLNNSFQSGGQETIDISCVCGANAYLRCDLSAGDWTSNGGAISPVMRVENKTRYENTGRVGVFPYGCDNCTSSDAPPECVGKHSHLANKEPICNVQRSAAANQGGTVRVSFLGWTPVPC